MDQRKNNMLNIKPQTTCKNNMFKHETMDQQKNNILNMKPWTNVRKTC